MNKDFETLYHEMLEDENLKEKWAQYKEKNNKKWTIFISLALILDIILLIARVYGNSTILFIAVLDVFIYVVLSIIFSRNKEDYKKTFKNIIIKKIIDNFYEDIHYNPDGAMPPVIYNEARCGEVYNKYYSNDYFRGNVNNKKDSIEFAEVKTQMEHISMDSEGNLHKDTTTIFNGLFAKININKSIQTELKIKTNWIGVNRKKDKLEMDSQLFEKNFDVYTNNQIIGMQLLTSDVMEMLVEFKNTMKIEYEVYVYHNKIYLRFMTGPMFNVKISSKEMLEKEAIQKFYKILEFTHSLSKQLIEIIEHTEV